MSTRENTQRFYCPSCQRERPVKGSIKTGHFRKCQSCIERIRAANESRNTKQSN